MEQNEESTGKQDSVQEVSATERVLHLGQKRIVLIGTAHVSGESIKEVENVIRREMPHAVAIELDEKRLESIKNPEAWRNMDIITILRKKQAFLMLANLVLSSYQKRMGQSAGVKPGDEMMAAINVAESLGIRQVMVDRSVSVTMRRAWAKNSFWGKCKLFSALIASAFGKEEVSPDEIENLKSKSEMDNMMAELSEYLPAVKEVLIDERDRYLASHIWQAALEQNTQKLVAVLGAGHLNGVIFHLERIASGNESPDCLDIEDVPPKKLGSKIAAWIIPVLIVVLIALGFIFGGRAKGWNMLSSWVLWNGVLAGIGALLAAGHPLTVLVAIVGAPFTSLCPFVGIGMLTGILQAILKKPKVVDMENIQQDVTNIRGFYKNRILRVLLVFLLSSIGSSIGTFVAGASFVKAITTFFDKIVDFITSVF